MSAYYFLGALFGLVGGSFLGVVVERGMDSGQWTVDSLKGRSRCSQCKHQLRWFENIPLVSFLFLRGRCRTCHSPIPYWLPLVELAGAAAGAAIAAQIAAITVINFITVINVIAAIFVAAALITIFFSDLVYGLIPDWAVVMGSTGAVLCKVPYLTVRYGTLHLAVALSSAAFFWLLVKLTRGRGMGSGDVTLAFFLGLWLGWPTIVVGLWLAFVLGAGWGIFLILIGKKKLGQTIPFGPFLIIGSLLTVKWGQFLLDKLF